MMWPHSLLRFWRYINWYLLTYRHIIMCDGGLVELWLEYWTYDL